MKNRILMRARPVRGGVLAILGALLLFEGEKAGANRADLELERSADLSLWEFVPIRPDMLSEAGEILLPADEDGMFFRLRDRSDETVPEGFTRIPAGTYERGDLKYELSEAVHYTPHRVYVNEFTMTRTVVTYEEWREVYDWAILNGYSFANPGQRGSDAHRRELPDTPENNRHPVVNVNWYDVVKWCNAKSERDGLTPVYYANEAKTALIRTISYDVTNAQVHWEADGYRLPTEAEWEKAARGGLEGKRWPWGDEPIDGARANYWDSDEVNGTTAVGSFPPNNFGLYDMAGNVWERCWDWYTVEWYNQAGSRDADSRGPVSGWSRVIRGGSVWEGPQQSKVALRWGATPIFGLSNVGFRLVRRQ